MSFSILPSEVLLEIFQHLSSKDVTTCKKVCQGWNRAFDNAGERFWKNLCVKDFTNIYKEARKKSGLTWRELANSLMLWSEVATAKARVYEATARRAIKFQILQNGVVACPNENVKNSLHINTHDTIVYYKLDTLEEFNREHFDVKFHYYEENESIIVIVVGVFLGAFNKIRIIPKYAKNNFLEVNVKNTQNKPWILHDDEVIYRNSNNEILCAKLIDKKAFLVNDYSSSVSWSTNFDDDPYFPNLQEVKLEYNNVLIIMSNLKPGILHIYYNEEPKSVATKLKPKLSRSDSIKKHFKRETTRNKADKTVDLNFDKVMDDERFKLVGQLDVVETVGGHKVVVLYCGRIFVVDLSHDGDEERKGGWTQL